MPTDPPTADPYPLEDNLGYLLNRCAHAMAARFERELAPHGVTLAQWGAMIAIRAGRGDTPTALARAVGTDKGATTRLIARMVEKGLISRAEHHRDGRSTHLALTPAAEALMPRLMALSRSVNAETLAALPEAEGQALKASLARLLAALAR